MTGRVAESAAVSALALVLTLAIAAPVLRAPSDRIFGMEIVGRHYDPFTVMEQFGRPIVLGVYAQPLTDVPGALLARASGPVAAYNWLVLLTFPLSAAAAYLLARYLALSPASAIMAAIAFAFSPFHLAHAAYHPHIAQTQWLPLYFLALWRCLDHSTPAAIGLLAVSIAGVTLSNFYGGLIAASITPAAIAAYWFFTSRRAPGSRRRLATTIGSLIVIAGGGLAYAWYAARTVVVDRSAFAFARDDLFRYSAKWWSYFVPPVEHPLLGGLAGRMWNAAGVHEGLLEQQVSLGWGVVALGLVAVAGWLHLHRPLLSRSGRLTDQGPGIENGPGTRNERPGTRSSLTIVPVLAIVAAVALVCSLSPERAIGPFTFVRPSAVLYRVVPMFRSYARFGAVVQLMAALLAGIGAERLWGRRRGVTRSRIACVALLALAGAEYAVWPPALWRDVLPTAAHRWVAQQPDRLHVLDCEPLTPESESIRWLTGDRISLLDGSFDDCAEPNMADKLSAAGYTHLLVRRGSETGWRAGRSGEPFSSPHTPAGLQVAARFDDGELFAVTARPPLVYTSQMTAFYGREHDETSTWRWMGPEASWRIENRADRPIVAVVDVETFAFHGARGLTLLLDGREVQTLTIAERRRTNRIGPLTLTPGGHELVFHPSEPPTIAADYVNNGDRRPLSFGVGTWHWTVEGEQP